MADEAENKSDLASAGNRIRETAKWLTVSLALLGGVLTAGIQFSGIGSLTPGSHRFDIAILGAVLATIGTALILFGTVWTASTPPARLAKLKSRGYLDWTLLQHDATIEELRDDYEKTLLARSRYAKAYWPDQIEGELQKPPDQEKADQANYKLAFLKPIIENIMTVAAYRKVQKPPDQEKADQANHKLAFLEPIIENIMTVASYRRLTQRWAISAVIIALGALIAAIGIGVFIWATNPPPSLKSSTASPSVVGVVGNSSLTLEEAGRTVLDKDLGPECPTDHALQVILLSKTDLGSDVVITQPDCNHVRVLVTPEWGTVR